jgi:hypothetical protein
MSDPKYASRPTGTSRTLRYRVWSLDVWGHASDDCPEAPVENDDGETPEHECACGGYEVNDRASQGYVEIVADGVEYNVGTEHAFVSYHPTDEQVLAALRDAGHFNDKATPATVTVEGDSEYSLDVTARDDGKPIYQLEREKNHEDLPAET